MSDPHSPAAPTILPEKLSHFWSNQFLIWITVTTSGVDSATTESRIEATIRKKAGSSSGVTPTANAPFWTMAINCGATGKGVSFGQPRGVVVLRYLRLISSSASY